MSASLVQENICIRRINAVIDHVRDYIVGLFQGMFEKNIRTFNPGWNQDAEKLDAFIDIRELQRQLKAQGVTLVTEADKSTIGPASIIVVDPDGNPIRLDPHV